MTALEKHFERFFTGVAILLFVLFVIALLYYTVKNSLQIFLILFFILVAYTIGWVTEV